MSANTNTHTISLPSSWAGRVTRRTPPPPPMQLLPLTPQKLRSSKPMNPRKKTATEPVGPAKKDNPILISDDEDIDGDVKMKDSHIDEPTGPAVEKQAVVPQKRKGVDDLASKPVTKKQAVLSWFGATVTPPVANDSGSKGKGKGKKK